MAQSPSSGVDEVMVLGLFQKVALGWVGLIVKFDIIAMFFGVRGLLKP